MKVYSQQLFVQSIIEAKNYEDLLLIMDIVFTDAAEIIYNHGSIYYNFLVISWKEKEKEFINATI